MSAFCFNPAAQTGRISSPAPTRLAKLRWVYVGLGLMKCKPGLMLVAAAYISLYWALQLRVESRALALQTSPSAWPLFLGFVFFFFFIYSFHSETTPE